MTVVRGGTEMVLQAERWRVSGVVLDGTGEPAPEGTSICLGAGSGGGHTCEYGPETVGPGGEFTFASVAPGTYVIHIVTPDGDACFGAEPSTLAVSGEEELRVVAPCLQGPVIERYTVSGQVVDGSNAPAGSGTTICLGTGTGSSHVCRYGPQAVGSNGSFSFSNVAAGTYQICVKPSGGVCCFTPSPSTKRVAGNVVMKVTASCL
jgi:hypothetical protein